MVGTLYGICLRCISGSGSQSAFIRLEPSEASKLHWLGSCKASKLAPAKILGSADLS